MESFRKYKKEYLHCIPQFRKFKKSRGTRVKNTKNARQQWVHDRLINWVHDRPKSKLFFFKLWSFKFGVSNLKKIQNLVYDRLDLATRSFRFDYTII